ncbi:minor capsid protein [Burkholderia phage BCSR129]|nr:minor capsid protein [Burkholderia phage BCSR129]
MARFRASRERRRAPELPVATGNQLMYSAAIRDWYEKRLKLFINSMAADYEAEIKRWLKDGGALGQPTSDAMGADARRIFKRSWWTKFVAKQFERLSKAWANKAEDFGRDTASQFALKVDKHSFTSVNSSLKALGIEAPKNIGEQEFSERIAQYVEYNVSLLKRNTDEFKAKVQTAVWQSLTAPEPDQQGGQGIFNAIKDEKERLASNAELIAQDQTAKMTSVLNNARMESNGIDEFEWVHSSAGKTPRPCHVAWNGRIFSTQGGPNELYEVLEDGTLLKYEAGKDGAREGDIGKPGFAIRCRCRAKPVFRALANTNDNT